MKSYECRVDEKRCGDCLENTDDCSLFSDRLYILHTELVAYSESDESESDIAEDTESISLCESVESESGNTDPSDAKGTDQDPRDKIGGDRRDVEFLCGT